MDGAHCFRVLCSHPCCWDTELRCTRGIKRHTPARLRKHTLKHGVFPFQISGYCIISLCHLHPVPYSFDFCLCNAILLFWSLVIRAEDFPSLSIVNVSEWAGRGRPIKERPLYGADTEASLNDVSCVSLSKQTKDTQKIKR